MSCRPNETAQTVSLRVFRSGGAVDETVLVYFGSRGPYRFILDTGASFTLIDRSVVDQLHLPIVGAPRTLSGIFGSGPARVVHVTTWRAEDVSLPAADVYTAKGQFFNPFISGLLGSDVLSKFQSIIIDFEGGRLIFCG